MVDRVAEDADAAYFGMRREGLGPLRKHRAFLTVFILSAMLSALVLTYIFSERYLAQTTIYFQPSDVMRLTTHATQALGSPFPVPEFKVITQTITGLVYSDAMLRRIVTGQHLDVEEPRDLSGPWYVRRLKELKYGLADYASDAGMLLQFGRFVKGDPVQQAMARLYRQIKIRNEDSYVYTLQVAANTPQRAAAIADDISAALVDLLHQDDQGSIKKRSEETTALKDDKLREIEGIETSMRDLLASNDVASVKDELEKVTDRASKLQQERTTTMADLRQSDAKVMALAGKLRLPTPPESARDDNPAMTRRPSRINVDDYAKLTSNRLDAEVNSASLRARFDSLERSYAEVVARLQVLNRIQAAYDLMSGRLKSAQRDYTALTDALQELAIKTTAGQSELHIEAKAETPAVPVSPIKIYHVAAAGVLAALIAIGLAYVLDYLDIRVFLPPAGRRRRGRGPLRAPAPEPAGAGLTGD